MTAAFFAAALWAVSMSANAAGPTESSAKGSTVPVMEYEIASGDSLGSIALAHGVTIAALIEANGIENPDLIRIGDRVVIPGDPKNGFLTKRGVKLQVPKGITLSRIAELYEVSVRQIVRANKLKNPDLLREGQRLLIPGAKAVVELVPAPPCYRDPVTLYRVRTDETRTVSLTFCDGRPTPKGIETLSAISGPPRKAPPFPLHPRLAVLLQRVADKYPGQRIEIISGQRVRKVKKRRESYHNRGQAIDFRVAGVSNKKLSRFVRGFNRVGVGYYPNSVFIHLDTRDQSAYWIDYSGPGEKAIYGRAGMTKAEIARIRAARRKPHTETTPQAEVEAETDAEQVVHAAALEALEDAVDQIAEPAAEQVATPAPAPDATPSPVEDSPAPSA